MKKLKLLALSSDGTLVIRSRDGDHPVTRATPTVFLLLDTSESMAGDKLLEAQRGAIEFARSSVAKHYEVGLVAFNENDWTVSTATKNLPALERDIEQLTASGGTRFSGAIRRATSLIGGAGVIVLVTDGQPADRADAIAAAADAKKQGITLLTIGTEDADSAFLAQLASSPAGSQHTTNAQLGTAIKKAAALLPPSK